MFSTRKKFVKTVKVLTSDGHCIGEIAVKEPVHKGTIEINGKVHVIFKDQKHGLSVNHDHKAKIPHAAMTYMDVKKIRIAKKRRWYGVGCAFLILVGVSYHRRDVIKNEYSRIVRKAIK